jgi:hypothetical protein
VANNDRGVYQFSHSLVTQFGCQLRKTVVDVDVDLCCAVGPGVEDLELRELGVLLHVAEIDATESDTGGLKVLLQLIEEGSHLLNALCDSDA